MSFLSTIESIWQKDETWVINFFATLKHDIIILETDLSNALTWMAGHAQEIATDVQGVLGVIASLGLTISPPVAAAIAAANAAVAAVNAVAAAVNQAKVQGTGATATIAQAGVAAYQSVKSAQAITAAAQSHVAGSGTTVTAP